MYPPGTNHLSWRNDINQSPARAAMRDKWYIETLDDLFVLIILLHAVCRLGSLPGGPRSQISTSASYWTMNDYVHIFCLSSYIVKDKKN